MNIPGKIVLLLALVLSIQSCKKDEIVIADLSTNLFDADYNGPEFFSVANSGTSISMIDGEEVMRVFMIISVDRSLLSGDPPFAIQVSLQGGETYQINSIGLNDDTFSISDRVDAAGDVRCWQLNIANSGNIGGGRIVCETAE